MELGEQGDVDGSMALAQQADVLKRQHETLVKNATAPERSMSVCDICGIFISSTDNEARRQVSLFCWGRRRLVVAEGKAGGGI
jgi:RNA-binding protein Luc7-like 2